MMLNNIFKCDKCGSILVIPKSSWFEKKMICTICESPLRKLDEEFDLSEIVSEYETEEQE